MKEETFQIKMIRTGYVEQKMREGHTWDEAMKMFDELKAGRRMSLKRHNADST